MRARAAEATDVEPGTDTAEAAAGRRTARAAEANLEAIAGRVIDQTGHRVSSSARDRKQREGVGAVIWRGRGAIGVEDGKHQRWFSGLR